MRKVLLIIVSLLLVSQGFGKTKTVVLTESEKLVYEVIKDMIKKYENAFGKNLPVLSKLELNEADRKTYIMVMISQIKTQYQIYILMRLFFETKLDMSKLDIMLDSFSDKELVLFELCLRQPDILKEVLTETKKKWNINKPNQ